jgi:chromosome segregation ATPase
MKQTDPTPTPAAATPAVLTDKEIEKLRLDVDECADLGTSITLARVPRLLATLDAAVAQRDAASAERDDMDNEFQSLAMRVADYDERLDAARADLAEFARQTREAQASMMAAILDKEQERKRADAADRVVAALQAERNRRRWAETRASHWRREWYLTMDTLGVRSNELGRAHMAHRTALAQERQAWEQAERTWEARMDLMRTLLEADERRALAEGEALADSRARGERLAEQCEQTKRDVEALLEVFYTHSQTTLAEVMGEMYAKYVDPSTAAPASPALEPADQTTATAAQGQE